MMEKENKVPGNSSQLNPNGTKSLQSESSAKTLARNINDKTVSYNQQSKALAMQTTGKSSKGPLSTKPLNKTITVHSQTARGSSLLLDKSDTETEYQVKNQSSSVIKQVPSKVKIRPRAKINEKPLSTEPDYPSEKPIIIRISSAEQKKRAAPLANLSSLNNIQLIHPDQLPLAPNTTGGFGHSQKSSVGGSDTNRSTAASRENSNRTSQDRSQQNITFGSHETNELGMIAKTEANPSSNMNLMEFTLANFGNIGNPQSASGDINNNVPQQNKARSTIEKMSDKMYFEPSELINSGKFGFKTPTTKMTDNIQRLMTEEVDQKSESTHDVKKLIRENDSLRKQNNQKEELIGFLLNALKQKDDQPTPRVPESTTSKNIVKAPSSSELPSLRPFLSPTSKLTPQLPLTRPRLASAEKFLNLAATPVSIPSGMLSMQTPGKFDMGRRNSYEEFDPKTMDSIKPAFVKNNSTNLLITPKAHGSIVANNLGIDSLITKRVVSTPAGVISSDFENPTQLLTGTAKVRAIKPRVKFTSIKNDGQMKGGYDHSKSLYMKEGHGISMSNSSIISERDEDQEIRPKPRTAGVNEYGFNGCRNVAKERGLVNKDFNLNLPSALRLKAMVDFNETFNPEALDNFTKSNRPIKITTVNPLTVQKISSRGPITPGQSGEPIIDKKFTFDVREWDKLENVSNMMHDIQSAGHKPRNALGEMQLNSNVESIPQGSKEQALKAKKVSALIVNSENSQIKDSPSEKIIRIVSPKNNLKPEKFPKDVFNINIRKKFFC